MLLFFAACTGSGLAQPMVITPRWQVTFPPTATGTSMESVAVTTGESATLVVIAGPGADAANPKLHVGTRVIPATVIGHDPVSRLGFLKVAGAEFPKPVVWSEEVGGNATAALRVVETAGFSKCRSTGWVKQVGGKILPFALLRVTFSKSVPLPGTPLVDDAGRVVAIVFQTAGSGNSGYAIPAEAVHRVGQDLVSSGKLIRGWLGLALRADSQVPQICRLLPDSPATGAGIKVNDVILSIGERQVSDYADAANAFFYLIPGRPVKVKLLRNAEQLEFTMTPVKPQS